MSKRTTADPLDGLSEEEIAELCDFKPVISDNEMEQIEKNAQQFGVNRRITLAILARDADNLSNTSIEAPDVFGAMRESVEAFRDHARNLLEMAETACLRVAIADCREAVAG
jgi:hypothetical protein